MAGKLYRALARNQNLQPVADLIDYYVSENRKKEQETALANIANEYINKAGALKDQSISPQEVSTMGMKDFPTGGVSSISQNPLMSNLLSQNRLNTVDANIPQTGTATLDKYDPSVHEKNLNNLKTEALMKIAGGDFSKANPNKLNIMNQLIDAAIQNNKPEARQFFNLAEGQQLFSRDKTGNIKLEYENKKDFQPRVNNDKSLGSYTGQDGYEYTKMMRADGSTYELRSDGQVREAKGTTVKVDIPKSDKWKDVSEFVSMLGQNEYYDKQNGKMVPLTPQMKEQYRNQAYHKAIGNLSGDALKWYDEKIKGEWNRENMSNIDFMKELEEAVVNDEISLEAAQDLKDFAAWRPRIFNLDKQATKKEAVNYSKRK